MALKVRRVSAAQLDLKGRKASQVRMERAGLATQLTAARLRLCTAGLCLSISAQLHRFMAVFFLISEGLPNGNSTSDSA
jgi:hypothetical protein